MKNLKYVVSFLWCVFWAFVFIKFFVWCFFQRKKEEKKLEYVPEPTRTQKIEELIWHRRNLRYHFEAGEISENDYNEDLEFINKGLLDLGQQP